MKRLCPRFYRIFSKTKKLLSNQTEAQDLIFRARFFRKKICAYKAVTLTDALSAILEFILLSFDPFPNFFSFLKHFWNYSSTL